MMLNIMITLNGAVVGFARKLTEKYSLDKVTLSLLHLFFFSVFAFCVIEITFPGKSVVESAEMYHNEMCI